MMQSKSRVHNVRTSYNSRLCLGNYASDCDVENDLSDVYLREYHDTRYYIFVNIS